MFSRFNFNFLGLLLIFYIESVFSALIKGLGVLEGLDLGFCMGSNGVYGSFWGVWGVSGLVCYKFCSLFSGFLFVGCLLVILLGY